MIRRSYEFLDAVSMKSLYIALVRPHLEFSNVAWAPRLERDKNLLESVQRRATKLIPEYKDLEYEDRLRQLNLPSLRYRRARGDMIEVYKYTHGKYTVNENLLSMNTSVTRGHSYKLEKVRCNTSLRQNFFNCRVVDSWNRLPDSVVTAPSIASFEARLDKVWHQHKYATDLKFPLAPQKISTFEITSDDSRDHLTSL